MADNEDPTLGYWSGADLKSAQSDGMDIRDNPQNSMPPLAGLGQMPQPNGQDRLFSALQGFRSAVQGAQQGAGLGDPFTAALSGLAGAAAAPNPQMIAAQRAQMQMQMLSSLPVEAISPNLVKIHPELQGVPLAIVDRLAPILERDAVYRQSQLNPQEIAALGKVARGESIGASDLVGVRKGIISDTALQNAGLDKQVSAGLAQQLVTGEISPSLARGRGRVGMQALVLAKQIDPNFNASRAELNYQTQEAGAKLTGGGSSQMVARAATSAADQLDALQTASDNFSRANAQLLNKPIIALAQQNNPEAQKFLIAIQTARAEYATALNRGLAPTSEQLKDAEKALPDTITAKQLPGAIDQIRMGLSNTVKGQMQQATLQSGAQLAPSPKAIRMRAPDGTSGNIPVDKVADAEAAGFVRL